MPIVYKKLFHLLIERNIKKGELQKMAGITGSIMARLAKDETVKTDTIGKICDALDCQPEDIMEYVIKEDEPDRYGLIKQYKTGIDDNGNYIEYTTWRHKDGLDPEEVIESIDDDFY